MDNKPHRINHVERRQQQNASAENLERRRMHYVKMSRARAKNVYPSGSKRYYRYLEREKKKEKATQAYVLSEEMRIKQRDSLSGSFVGDVAFKNGIDDSENTYLIAEAVAKKKRKRALKIKKDILFIICLVISIVLNALSFHFPFTPTAIKIDFSVFPELVVCLVINPVVAILLTILKNAIYILFNLGNLPSAPNKIILDTVFLLVSYFIFRLISSSKLADNMNLKREQNGKTPRKYTDSFAIISVLCAGIITSLISVFTHKTILLPLLTSGFKSYGYTYPAIFENYKNAFEGVCRLLPFVKKIIPSLDNLNQGIIFFNLPLNFFKYFVSGLMGAFIYEPVSEIINRQKSNN